MRVGRALAFLAMLLPGAAAAQQPMPAGRFDYYLLSLSWSPTWCAHHGGAGDAEEECGQRRGFVVHGLWPQNLAGPWPAFCLPVSPVPPALAARETAIMPDAEMIEHEWTKHGSCSGLKVDAYFAAIDRAFAAFHRPAALSQANHPVTLALAEAKRALVAANPGLEPDMIAIRCTPEGEVEELRLCLDRGFGYRACGADQVDACPATVRFPAAGDSAP
jgi:ribonuclease T2